MKHDLERLVNKRVYITPYNNLAINFREFLEKNRIQLEFLGYIDSHKVQERIYPPSYLRNGNFDYVIIMNSKYHKNIFEVLNIENKLQKEKILFSIYPNNKYKLFLYSNKAQKKIVCFGNCQMRLLNSILQRHCNHLAYTSEYIINYTEEFDENFAYRKMQEADIIIFQPMNEKKNFLMSDKNIRETLTSKILISIPFVRIDGIYSLEYNFGEILGEEYIIKLLKDGNTKEEIFEKFEKGLIDFDLDSRFENSFNLMNKKYPKTTIQLSDFIKENYKNKKLFHANLHPTPIIFYEIIRQLNQLIDIEILLNEEDCLIGDLSEIVSTISPFDENKYHYKNNPYFSLGWLMKGILIIDLIVTRYEK